MEMVASLTTGAVPASEEIGARAPKIENRWEMRHQWGQPANSTEFAFQPLCESDRECHTTVRQSRLIRVTQKSHRDAAAKKARPANPHENRMPPNTSDFKRGLRWDSHTQRGVQQLDDAFAPTRLDRHETLREMLLACAADGPTAAVVQIIYDWEQNVPLNEDNLIAAMKRMRRNWEPIELWVTGTDLKTAAFNCSSWPLPEGLA